MPYSRILLTGLCVCGFAATSLAAPVHLNIRPGLWQMTSTAETHGLPPIPADVLARMSPAQRARVRAAMAASMGRGAKPHVSKFCVTEKSLQRGFDPSQNMGNEHCTPTILSSSASSMDMRAECTGERRGDHSSGRFHFEAPNPETMNGTIHMTMSDGAHTMTVKSVMHGKWLSADCGKYAHEN